MKYHYATFATLMLLLAARAHADCSAVSADARPHLVELYSSEGCSSCPPAENWLRTLHTGAQVVPLEFHVDYWNDLGWRDRFSDARYTARQQLQARRDGGTSVYTPQVVLDGRSWSGWSRGGHLAPPEAATLSLRLAVEGSRSGNLRVRVEGDSHGSGDLSAYRVFVAVVEDGLTTRVQAGENRGALLRHDHVVRAWAGPLESTRAEAVLPLPEDVVREHAMVVAFAEERDLGRTAQVVTLPLVQCRN